MKLPLSLTAPGAWWCDLGDPEVLRPSHRSSCFPYISRENSFPYISPSVDDCHELKRCFLWCCYSLRIKRKWLLPYIRYRTKSYQIPSYIGSYLATAITLVPLLRGWSRNCVIQLTISQADKERDGWYCLQHPQSLGAEFGCLAEPGP